ncbi:MAG: TatD family hydrolase [Ruminococcaceae bacterium]|nr:TatD family hydrolase [Oscillospiraceae bacterium]
MNNIFDSHAHYDDEAFSLDRDEVLSSLPKKGVTGVISCGINLLSSYKTLKLANEYDFVYAALGIHPEDAREERSDDLDAIVRFLRTEKKAIAVGEIGLDYYYEDAAPRETQIDLFERQLELAKELDLPVIVHNREAHEDTLNILKKYRPQGVLHCFSGSVEMAREVVKLGMYIGMGGVVTFKNARKAVDVVADIPIEKLLLETDCPYLAPVPYRGKRNDSSLILFIAERIGEIRGIKGQEVADITCQNTKELFRL